MILILKLVGQNRYHQRIPQCQVLLTHMLNLKKPFLLHQPWLPHRQTAPLVLAPLHLSSPNGGWKRMGQGQVAVAPKVGITKYILGQLDSQCF